MIETNVSRPQHDTFLQVVHSYYQLTKPRIIPLLLITTAGSMWIAAQGEVDPWLLIITMIGGTLAAASAQTINCIYDRDIDYDMERITPGLFDQSIRIKPQEVWQTLHRHFSTLMKFSTGKTWAQSADLYIS